MVDAKSAARQERCKFLIYTAVEVGAALTNAFGTAFIPAMGRGACKSAFSYHNLSCEAGQTNWCRDNSFPLGGELLFDLGGRCVSHGQQASTCIVCHSCQTDLFAYS